MITFSFFFVVSPQNARMTFLVFGELLETSTAE